MLCCCHWASLVSQWREKCLAQIFFLQYRLFPWKKCALLIHAWTIELISDSGGNFQNLIDKKFIDRFPCCNFPTIHKLLNEIIKIPTITRNQLYCPCVFSSPQYPRPPEPCYSGALAILPTYICIEQKGPVVYWMNHWVGPHCHCLSLT